MHMDQPNILLLENFGLGCPHRADTAVLYASEAEFGVTRGRMIPVILETVQVFVSFPTNFAAIWLFFLHADSAGVRNLGQRIHDGKAAVTIIFELLRRMAVLGV